MKVLSAAALLLLFTAVSLFALRPLPALWTTHLVGNYVGDQDMFAWNIWWTHLALTSPDYGLFHCPLIFHPHGFDLLLHSHALVYSLLGALLHIAGATIPAAYNTVVLLGFVLTGTGTALFTREIGARWPGAIAAGLILLLWPHHTESIFHLNYNAPLWIPWTVWAAARAARTGRAPWALLAGLLLGSSLWHDYYVAAFTGLVWLFFVLWAAQWHRGQRVTPRRWRHLCLLTLAVALAADLWLLAPMLRIRTQGPFPLLAGHDLFVADLLALLLPSTDHALWWRPLQLWYADMQIAEPHQSLGLATLTLAALALVGHGRWPGARGWALAALAFLVLSFGERVHFAGSGDLRPGPREFSLWMPYTLLKHLPPFDALRAPARFLYPAMFCLAVLAAFGADRLLAPVGRPSRRAAAATLLCAVIFAERLPRARTTHDIETIPTMSAALCHQLAQDPLHGSVLELPLWWDETRFSNAQQMIHGRPAFAGHTSRFPLRRYYENIPGLTPLTADGKLYDRDEVTVDPALLDEAHWRRMQWLFDLTHIIAFPEWTPDHMARLPAVWRPELIGTDRDFRLYRLSPPMPSDFDLDLAQRTHGMHFVRGFGEGGAQGIPLLADHGEILVRVRPHTGARIMLTLRGRRTAGEQIETRVSGGAPRLWPVPAGASTECVFDVSPAMAGASGHILISVSRRASPSHSLLFATRLALDIEDPPAGLDADAAADVILGLRPLGEDGHRWLDANFDGVIDAGDIPLIIDQANHRDP